MRSTLISVLFLAGCAGMTTPRPKEVRLTPDRVVVVLTDGERCFGDRAGATATASGWTGRLAGCGQRLAYEVRLDPHRNILQGLFVEVFDAIGARGLLAPGGAVTVTDADGREHLFVSPPPIPEHG